MAGAHLWNHSWNQDRIRHPWKYPCALSQTTSPSSHQSLGRHWSTFCHSRRSPRLSHEQTRTTCSRGCFHSAWSHDCHPLYCGSAVSVTVSGGHSLLLLSSIPVFELFTVSLSIHLSWTFELFSVFSHNKIKCLCTFMCKVLYGWMSFNFPLVNAWE